MVWNLLKVGSVIAGRGARACDLCGTERARWYCSSDEAYLCERCDRSVHTANTVARRHERMKLGLNGEPSKIKETLEQSKSIKFSSLQFQEDDADFFHKTWCRMEKRCRTARKSSRPSVNSMQEPFLSRTQTIKEKAEDDSVLLYNLVPSNDHLGGIAMPLAINIKLEPPSPSIFRDSIVQSQEGDDAHHRVPVYDPILQDHVTDSHGNFMEDLVPSFTSLYNDESSCKIEEQSSSRSCEATTLARICDNTSQPSEGALSLPSHELNMGPVGEIGTNLANEGSDIDTFDVMELCSNTDLHESTLCSDTQEVLPDMAVWRGAYEFDQHGTCRTVFKGNPFKGRGEREFGTNGIGSERQAENQWKAQLVSSKPLSLRLDYEEVQHAWSDRGSLWMDGQRPQVVPDSFSLNLLQGGKVEGQEVPVIGGTTGGREASVIRYRQKRHTRLFRKTIRYEVRKVNAERRPRLKGRFVKRSSFEGM